MGVKHQKDLLKFVKFLIKKYNHKTKYEFDYDNLYFFYPIYVIFYNLLFLCVFSIVQHAQELLSASQNRGGTTFNFKQELAKVQRALETATKDNNFIYHDKIPDIKALQPIGKAVVAKAAPLAQPMSAKFNGKIKSTIHSYTFIC